MKKITALLLAFVIALSLFVACGDTNTKTDEPDNPKATESQEVEESIKKDENQTKTEAPVGEILDAPEVTFDTSLNKIYIYCSFLGEAENEITSIELAELAFDQITEDTYLVYASSFDGILKSEEVVYEVTDADITGYYKYAPSENFTKETKLSQDELKKEVDSCLEIISILRLDNYNPNVKFRKSDAVVFATTGDVYVYDVIDKDGQATAQIAIDKTTGIIVSLKDLDGNGVLSVQDVKTDFEFPAYK